jgi:hypothetical protein
MSSVKDLFSESFMQSVNESAMELVIEPGIDSAIDSSIGSIDILDSVMSKLIRFSLVNLPNGDLLLSNGDRADCDGLS